MGTIIEKLTRPVCRRLKKVVQFNHDGDYRRRAKAMLLLHKGHTVKGTAELLCASRNSINKWLALFNEYGEPGLIPEQRGRRAYSINDEICQRLIELIQIKPEEFGWCASRWTSETLSRQINAEYKTRIHASTIRRLLPRLGIVWNRASPTLCIQDKEKAPKMKKIKQALGRANAENPVFYVEEVGARNVRQVKDVISGKYYSDVKDE